MQHRQQGKSQESAAAKAGISTRSGRRLEKTVTPRSKTDRHWRTRDDPLDASLTNTQGLPLHRLTYIAFADLMHACPL